MNKKLILMFGVLLVAILGVGVWLGVSMNGQSAAGASAYSQVVMSNGDVYFGKLSWFPTPKLTDVWVLQRSMDGQNQPQLGVSQFSKALSGPVGDLYLNQASIISWAPLRNDSQFVQAFINPSAVQQASQPTQPQGPSALPPGFPPSTPSSSKR